MQAHVPLPRSSARHPTPPTPPRSQLCALRTSQLCALRTSQLCAVRILWSALRI
eukprot:CAMPEP_0181233666 /NCGR_PEP_ID=MMETSP1096-20121128/36476_1 /TAXON_ID=156174 ORGANISM="Chrysochromulina ericina, Strain CCMP281" /NCGR_SAMPLE_ID=MMETSP1096 /ASSEMBLY_ACC=CAM_ASM_000453 /LENGTH=53 /DNA_ID=CAMNT_0023328219 /DNA_START=293 /DNA_END=451 /DNA_ORIENTATION=+